VKICVVVFKKNMKLA